MRNGTSSPSGLLAACRTGSPAKLGEEPWVLLHVGGDGRPNNALLDVVRAKYPKYLPTIYRRALRAGEPGATAYLARTVATSSLSRAEKVALFSQACDRWLIVHRLHALRELRAIDETAFLSCCQNTVRTERGLSADGTVPDCDGLDVLIPIMLLARTEIDWETVIRVLERRPVGERMEMLRALGRAIRDDKKQPFNAGPYRLICDLLSDRTVWESKDGHGWQSEWIGDSYKRLAVGDYAAMILADYFDLGILVCPQSTPAEWADLQEKVKAAVEKELAAGKK